MLKILVISLMMDAEFIPYNKKQINIFIFIIFIQKKFQCAFSSLDSIFYPLFYVINNIIDMLFLLVACSWVKEVAANIHVIFRILIRCVDILQKMECSLKILNSLQPIHHYNILDEWIAMYNGCGHTKLLISPNFSWKAIRDLMYNRVNWAIAGFLQPLLT